MDLDQVIAIRAADQPGEAVLARKGSVADRPASSVKKEKEFVGFGDVVHRRTLAARGPDLRSLARFGLLDSELILFRSIGSEASRNEVVDDRDRCQRKVSDPCVPELRFR